MRINSTGDPAIEVNPFSYLNGELRILVLDDTPCALEAQTNVLREVPLFTVFSASTFEQADNVIASNNRIHCLVADLGLGNKPLYYSVEKYAAKITTVVCSGRTKMEIGGDCIARGAKKVLDKPFLSGTLREETFNGAMVGIADPCRTWMVPKFQDALAGHKGTDGVTRWALDNFLSDRYFREKCQELLGVKAKILHFTFEVFQAAYEFHTRGKALAPRDYRQMRDYYFQHESEIKGLLA